MSSGQVDGSGSRTAALAGCSKSSGGLIDVREVRSHSRAWKESILVLTKLSDYSLLIRAAQPETT